MNWLHIAWIVVASTLCVQQGDAYAQASVPGFSQMTPENQRHFLVFRQSQTFGRALALQLVRIRQVLFPECQNLQMVLQPPVVIYQPARFDVGPTAPSGGAWLERVRLPACPGVPPLNIFFHATKDTAGAPALRTVPTLPGLSNADPILQQDTMRLLGPMAQSRLNCQVLHVVNTSVVQKYPAQKSWVEHWSIKACGRIFRYEVSFTPSIGRPGTTFAFKELP